MNNATAEDVELLREGGQLLAAILKKVVQAVAPGLPTAELDALAEREMRSAGAEPSFRGYRKYPAVMCISRNDRIVHGIPSKEERIEEGDVVGLDIGVRYRGRVTDMAVTVGVGKISTKASRLIAVTKEALIRACQFVRPGITTGDLGAHIQAYVESQGFAVIRELVGHGVGLEVHEDPMIPNFGVVGEGTRFEEGMVIAVEPMVAAGHWKVKTLPDGWTVAMADGSLGAHFEHTLAVTSKGSEILTQTADHDPWP